MTPNEPELDIASNGHVTVRQLRGGVASTVLMGDGACVTVLLRDGVMEWELEFGGRMWKQRVVYRKGEDQAGVRTQPDEVGDGSGPSVAYHRPKGRLQPRAKPLTIDSITGAG